MVGGEDAVGGLAGLFECGAVVAGGVAEGADFALEAFPFGMGEVALRVRFQGAAEGMLITQGGRFNGYGLYLLKGKPVFTYNALALRRFRQARPWLAGVAWNRIDGRLVPTSTDRRRLSQ